MALKSFKRAKLDIIKYWWFKGNLPIIRFTIHGNIFFYKMHTTLCCCWIYSACPFKLGLDIGNFNIFRDSCDCCMHYFKKKTLNVFLMNNKALIFIYIARHKIRWGFDTMGNCYECQCYECKAMNRILSCNMDFKEKHSLLAMPKDCSQARSD